MACKKNTLENTDIFISEVLMPININEASRKALKSDLLQVLLQLDHRLFQLVVNHWNLEANTTVEKIREGLTLNTSPLNIKDLADVYCDALFCINRFEQLPELEELTRRFSHTDVPTAHDLVRKMATKEGFSLKDVLTHPFHWSVKEKVDFICQAFDIVNLECNYKNEPTSRQKTKDAAKKYNLDEYKDKVFDVQEGWLEQLKLKSDEMQKINKKHRGSRSIICESTLNTKKETSYDTSSLLSLMRFFRNYHVHYCEKNIQIREAFGSFYEGYWKFFYCRFPRFFMYVYDRMKEFMPIHSPTNVVQRVNMWEINSGGLE